MSSGLIKNVSTDRVILKNYYRKAAGFMSVMNSVFMLGVAMIAFYISENFDSIANISSGSEGSEAGLLSIVAFASLIAMFFKLAFGVAGMRGEKDENFFNQKVLAIVGLVLNGLYIISTIIAFADSANDINVAEDITYFMIGVCIALAAIVYDVIICIFTTKARQYCDRKSGKAAEVTAPIDKDALDKKADGIVLSGLALALLSVWMLCFGFNSILNEYMSNIAVDYSLDANIYMALTLAGILGVAGLGAAIVLDIKNNVKAGVVAKGSMIYSAVVLVVAVIFSISTIGKEYALPVLGESRMFEYYIFMYVLSAFSAILGVVSFKRHL